MPITTTPSGGPQGEFSTYTPIYSQTLSAAVTSVTLSNIPSTFTDLVLIMQAKSTGTYGSLRVNVNSDSATNYSHIAFGGTGSSAGSSKASNQNWFDFCRTSGLSSDGFGIYTVNFMNYSNATTYKTVLDRTNVQFGTAGDGVEAIVGLWRSTAPINSITLATPGGGTFGNFAIGSTFTLYGIKAAVGVPKALGGDSVVTDGSYWYHTFLSTSTFTPLQSLTTECLVVAGGGGGGARSGGGGGAGGYRSATGLSVTATNYTITVGSGGTGSTNGSVSAGADGTSSTFSTITSAGGGGGGSGATGLGGGRNGGSGGGRADTAGGSIGQGNTPATTPSQGNNGGSSGNNGGSGGGGATAVGGANSGFDEGGIGGAGSNSLSTWATITGTGASGYYAGGGGGGSYSFTRNGGVGGAGGGGTGGNGSSMSAPFTGTSGTNNTGGGGGGSSRGYDNGGNGGSGIVIVRYPI